MLAEPISPETTSIAQQGDEGLSSEVHSEADRYDGSRTPADRQLQIWHLYERDKRTVGDIARFFGMKPYTVQAVINRKDSIVAEARMLLRANALEFAHNLIQAGPEAAKRGKMEGIKATLESVGVLEPVRNQALTQVGVRVELHGGPEPVSLASVVVEGEK